MPWGLDRPIPWGVDPATPWGLDPPAPWRSRQPTSARRGPRFARPRRSMRSRRRFMCPRPRRVRCSHRRRLRVRPRFRRTWLFPTRRSSLRRRRNPARRNRRSPASPEIRARSFSPRGLPDAHIMSRRGQETPLPWGEGGARPRSGWEGEGVRCFRAILNKGRWEFIRIERTPSPSHASRGPLRRERPASLARGMRSPTIWRTPLSTPTGEVFRGRRFRCVHSLAHSPGRAPQARGQRLIAAIVHKTRRPPAQGAL